MPDLFGRDHIADSIARLRQFEPPEGYFLAFGGGKDSVVLLELAKRAGVKFDAHYHFVTIEPPELTRFVRDQHPEVVIDRPGQSFFQLLPVQGFPIRQRRWCCRMLKEGHGNGRMTLLGIRWAESVRRRGSRKMVEVCRNDGGKRMLSPIIDWSDEQVWDFIRREKLPYCSLYDEGFKRLGCIACPMHSASMRRAELARWPKFEKAYRAAFRKLFDNRMAKGTWNVKQWPSGDACFDWWISGQPAACKAQEWFAYDATDEDA
jgi:phosphoadenosine phosphosulfate reductase